jgi:hypothetical protein
LGSIALNLGFLGRIAAAGNFLIFLGVLIVHAADGWTMNWFGMPLPLTGQRFRKANGCGYLQTN